MRHPDSIIESISEGGSFSTSLRKQQCAIKANRQKLSLPDRNFTYRGVDANGKPLKAIPYKELDLNLPWQSFDISHELTKKGIQKFVAAHFRQRLRAAVNERIGLVITNCDFSQLLNALPD